MSSLISYLQAIQAAAGLPVTVPSAKSGPGAAANNVKLNSKSVSINAEHLQMLKKNIAHKNITAGYNMQVCNMSNK